MSRRRRWDARLTAAIGEARWAATVLATSLAEPALSADATTLYWNENRPRLQAAQDEFEALGTTNPTEARGVRAQHISDELTSLTEAMSALVALRGAAPDLPEADVTLEQSRAAVHDHSRSLLSALDEQAGAGESSTTQSPSDQGEGSPGDQGEGSPGDQGEGSPGDQGDRP
jgi:hypothetical protein